MTSIKLKIKKEIERPNQAKILIKFKISDPTHSGPSPHIPPIDIDRARLFKEICTTN